MTALLLLALLWPTLPDAHLTPGKVATSNRDKVCVAGYSDTQRKTSDKLKDEVYAEYGIRVHVTGFAEIDHRVPLSMGGADVLENLWPQSYHLKLGAHEKDFLEDRIHAMVCHEHSMSLADGQKIFLGNWITAYRKYVVGAK